MSSNREPIWLLTVLFLRSDATEKTAVPPRAPGGAIERSRTWGWFPDRQTAIEAVMSNDGDMYECGYYNYAVIEEMPWGSIATADTEVWFSAQPLVSAKPLGDYLVTEIEKPKPLERMVSFGMG